MLGVVCGVLLVGKMQPAPSSIMQLRLNECAPPCWVGIMPGETSIADAKAKIMAAFIEDGDLTIRDTSFTDRSRPFTTLEYTIEGDNFYLVVQLHLAQYTDGQNEVVQSIDLFQSSQDGQSSAPTVADILGAFGPPDGIVVEAFTTIGFEISLKYSGLDATFYTPTNRAALTENTHIFLEKPVEQKFYRPWVGFRTLDLEE